MPKTKSAQKALLVSNRRKEYNLRIKKELKTAVKKFRKEKRKEDFKKIVSLLDKAGSNKIVHKNTAARLKSRLSKLLKKEKVKEIEKPKKKLKIIKKTRKKK